MNPLFYPNGCCFYAFLHTLRVPLLSSGSQKTNPRNERRFGRFVLPNLLILEPRTRCQAALGFENLGYRLAETLGKRNRLPLLFRANPNGLFAKLMKMGSRKQPREFGVPRKFLTEDEKFAVDYFQGLVLAH
jgi:hypothetical protein